MEKSDYKNLAERLVLLKMEVQKMPELNNAC